MCSELVLSAEHLLLQVCFVLFFTEPNKEKVSLFMSVTIHQHHTTNVDLVTSEENYLMSFRFLLSKGTKYLDDIPHVV